MEWKGGGGADEWMEEWNGWTEWMDSPRPEWNGSRMDQWNVTGSHSRRWLAVDRCDDNRPVAEAPDDGGVVIPTRCGCADASPDRGIGTRAVTPYNAGARHRLLMKWPAIARGDESFFSSLKTERTARKTHRSRDQARADVSTTSDGGKLYSDGIRRWLFSPIAFERGR